MLKRKNGKGQKQDLGVFFGNWDDKRIRWIFLQRKGGIGLKSADYSDIGFNMRVTQYQSNPSMGNKPASEGVLVEAFWNKYHPLLLLAFVFVKVDKARFAEPVLHKMVAIVPSRRWRRLHTFIWWKNNPFYWKNGQLCQFAAYNKCAPGRTGHNHRAKNCRRE